MTIARETLAAIRAAAAATPAVEICGLLLGTGDRVERAQPCANVAADPARRFEIDPTALFAAHRGARGGGAAVIGCYHSHPTGIAVPSACDAASAMGDGAVWLIVAEGTVRAWRTVAAGAFVEIGLVVEGGPTVPLYPSPTKAGAQLPHAG